MEDFPFRVIFAALFSAALILIPIYSNRTKKNKIKIRKDLSSVEMQILAVEDNGDFSKSGRNFSMMLRVHPASLGVRLGQVKNVITLKRDEHTQYVFEYVGEKMLSEGEGAIDINKVYTGIAIKFQSRALPNCHIVKSGINKTSTYDEIDQNLLPRWAAQRAKIFSAEEDKAQVVEWIHKNPDLASILRESELALMLVRHNFIEAYYQSLPPTDKRSYAEFKRRLAIISTLNSISFSFGETNVNIELLKNEEKTDG